MIFVITGTEQFPFDRFVKEIDGLKQGCILDEDVFVQLGACQYEPERCAWERFIGYDEMAERIAAARLVITHAGAGTTLLCLKSGQRPIIVTRMKKYGEHVDDHQVVFARNFERSGRVDAVYEIDELRSVVTRRLKPHTDNVSVEEVSGPEALTTYLNALLESWA